MRLYYNISMLSNPINTSDALKHFKQNDPLMYHLLSASLSSTNPIKLPKPLKPSLYFNSITKSIVSQQISVKAARSIYSRVETTLEKVSPESVIKIDFEKLKACGLSSQKTNYLKRIAEVWSEIPVGKFGQLDNEEIIAELTKLPGIGRWTAEMFLMFSMARPDVFSFGDFGLMQSLYRNYNYKPHFSRKIHTTVESWSPHRTLASLALWHQKDNPPVS